MFVDSVTVQVDSVNALIIYATRILIVPEMGIQKYMPYISCIFFVGALLGYLIGSAVRRQKQDLSK